MEGFANFEPKSAGGETILVVEDEEFVRGVTQAVLESAGYSVLAVRDASEAQRTYEQHSGRMDLLLTDIVLPGEDGRRLAQRLSQMNSALQILLVTGYWKETDRKSAGGEEEKEEEDDDRILRKPFAASILLRKVRELLDQKQV